MICAARGIITRFHGAARFIARNCPTRALAHLLLRESERWEATGMSGPHHLRAAGTTLSSLEQDLIHKMGRDYNPNAKPAARNPAKTSLFQAERRGARSASRLKGTANLVCYQPCRKPMFRSLVHGRRGTPSCVSPITLLSLLCR